MRRSHRVHGFVASALILALVASVSGLFGAAGGALVTIAVPADGARVSGVIEVKASVRDAQGLSYVIFGINDERPISTNRAPFTWELDTRTLPDGPHRLFCEAYDPYGMIGSSRAITIHVSNASASDAPAPAPLVSPGPPGRVAAAPAAARGPVAEPVAVAAGVAPTSSPARTRGHTVVVNGRPVSFDVAPSIRENRIQVGFRALLEEMGATVTWLAQERTARGVAGPLTIEVAAGSRTALVNGDTQDMGLPSFVEQARLMVPLRFLGDATGSQVAWDGEACVASLSAPPRAIAKHTPAH